MQWHNIESTPAKLFSNVRISCHTQSDTNFTCMIHAIGPSFTVWLGTFDGSNVVGFAVVIPGVNFDDIKLLSRVNEGLPSPGIEVLVPQIYELSSCVQSWKRK